MRNFKGTYYSPELDGGDDGVDPALLDQSALPATAIDMSEGTGASYFGAGKVGPSVHAASGAGEGSIVKSTNVASGERFQHTIAEDRASIAEETTPTDREF